ncbi:MAG: Uma2 family endonuclease [Armatimonadetes bacterium]|nr:Uma2 family endonuclease [Armatimonadota bacterium]
MSVAPSRRHWTAEQYLRFERESDLKHELINGVLYAMSGGSVAHARLTARATSLIGRQLQGSPCDTFSSDLRVKVEATGTYTYPDLSVVCGQAEVEDDRGDTLLNPTALVEVLSPSTEAHDRGAKFEHYRRLGSLRDYVLISQDRPLVEVFSRGAEQAWSYTAYEGPEATAQVPAIGCSLELAALYENVQPSRQEPAIP